MDGTVIGGRIIRTGHKVKKRIRTDRDYPIKRLIMNRGNISYEATRSLSRRIVSARSLGLASNYGDTY
jgi:hypothetical protein